MAAGKSGLSPRRAQVIDILARYRSAKTERERRKVANSIKRDFPHIAENLNKLTSEGSKRAT